MEYSLVQGARVPKIGLGTWAMRGRSCREAVLNALELGYRHIDTAEMYDNEREIGSAIRQAGVPRQELFLTSKVWRTNVQHDQVLRACQASLERLGADELDLYLIHWPNPSVPIEETMTAMNRLLEEGMTRRIGVSNFSIDQLRRAQEVSRGPVFCDQVEYHPFHAQQALLGYCQSEDVLLSAYSPLARGRVSGNQELRRIGDRYAKTPAQVALRWLVQQRKVVAIPKASSLEHQRENIDVFDFELTPEEMASVAGG